MRDFYIHDKLEMYNLGRSRPNWIEQVRFLNVLLGEIVAMEQKARGVPMVF